MKIKIKDYRGDSQIPTKGYKNDCGFDLRSSMDIVVQKGERCIIPLCYGFEIPKGYYGQVEVRSSMSKKGLLNLGGIIDCGFTGEVHLICTSVFEDIEILKGDRIAQIIFIKIADNVKLDKVETLSDTDRGDGKFGSSGK